MLGGIRTIDNAPHLAIVAALSREEKLAGSQVSERCRHPANDVSAIHSR